MKYSIFILLSMFLVSVGCSGGDSEEGGSSSGDSTENTGSSQSSTVVDQQPDKPNPELRRGEGDNISVVHWNVDGGGSDQESVARALTDLGHYHVIGLTSVDKPKEFEEAIDKEWPKSYDHFQSKTGKITGAANQHAMILYDHQRFYLVSKTEVEDFEGAKLTGGDYPAPLVAHLRDNTNDKEFLVVLVHFANEAELRQQQVKGLLTWAKKMSQPIVVIGSFNFEYNVASETGNQAFNDFQADGVMDWVKPLEIMDIEWTDADGDGTNDSTGIMSDLMFVAGRARGWDSTCRILKKSRDFPDDDRTSNHRPVELILKQ